MATLSPDITDSACCTSPELITLSVGDIVREGLGQVPKQLPPWLFYDEAGSLLFERITALPEYYLTRTERALLKIHAPEMIALAANGKRLKIVELGAGSADKTRTLLAAALAYQGRVEYTPVDVSESALEAARERLQLELPAVSVRAQVGDYTRGLDLTPCGDEERRLVLSIGSSIGNYCKPDAIELLSQVANTLEQDDALLIGVDLAPSIGGKGIETLKAAYDDAQGVTAAFNKNILFRLNRELGADFNLDGFGHQIRWNEAESRIEMHLESLRNQTVRIGNLGLKVNFNEGETIHTENSCKYRSGEVEEILQAAGYRPARRWSDPKDWFAVYLAVVR